jgi:ubiquinol-cytochrome c reductase iron-sulfur subunit
MPNRRNLLGWLAAIGGGIAALSALLPFSRYMGPSQRAKAVGGPLEVDISDILPGQIKTILWRGKAFWFFRRTPEMLATLPAMSPYLLDTETPAPEDQPPYVDPVARSIDSELLVVEATCTHLGCVPIRLEQEGRSAVGDWWQGGFFCPCHQSAYDYSGRVVKRPAPRNLRIPSYRYAGPNAVVIGEDPGATAT